MRLFLAIQREGTHYGLVAYENRNTIAQQYYDYYDNHARFTGLRNNKIL